jgi:uncharacterized protein (DUF58 family)
MSLHPRLDDLLELRHQAHTLGLASYHSVNSVLSGLFASVFRGSGLDFDEVREYRAGDDVRNTDWHVTARTGTPHLKVFREERERTVMLCVDHGRHMSFGTRGTFKSVQAARAAALLGWAADNHHDRVGGLLFGGSDNGGLQYFRPARGRRSLWRILNTLTQDMPEAQADGDYLLTVLQRIDRGSGTGSLVFVIADFNREVSMLERTLGSLQQGHDVVLFPVDDPADRELPAMGQVVFEDAFGDLFEVNTDDEKGRQAYRAAWEHRRSELQKLAKRLGITLIPLKTNEDVHRTITLGLRQRLASRRFR